MPPAAGHTKSSMERTGKEYKEVHEWLDDPAKKAERHDVTKMHEYGTMFEQNTEQRRGRSKSGICRRHEGEVHAPAA